MAPYLHDETRARPERATLPTGFPAARKTLDAHTMTSEIKTGLDEVVAAESRISKVDGLPGVLVIGGFPLDRPWVPLADSS